MGTVWSKCVCVSERRRRWGGISLCDVIKREAVDLVLVFPPCPDETMTQHDFETAGVHARTRVCACERV